MARPYSRPYSRRLPLPPPYIELHRRPLLGSKVNNEGKDPKAALDDQGEAVAVAVAVAVAGVVTGTVFSTVVSTVFSTVTVRGGGVGAASS
jgi:hypothetical protein